MRKINENQLKAIVAESVKRTLEEGKVVNNKPYFTPHRGSHKDDGEYRGWENAIHPYDEDDYSAFGAEYDKPGDYLYPRCSYSSYPDTEVRRHDDRARSVYSDKCCNNHKEEVRKVYKQILSQTPFTPKELSSTSQEVRTWFFRLATFLEENGFSFKDISNTGIMNCPYKG